MILNVKKLHIVHHHLFIYAMCLTIFTLMTLRHTELVDIQSLGLFFAWTLPKKYSLFLYHLLLHCILIHFSAVSDFTWLLSCLTFLPTPFLCLSFSLLLPSFLLLFDLLQILLSHQALIHFNMITHPECSLCSSYPIPIWFQRILVTHIGATNHPITPYLCVLFSHVYYMTINRSFSSNMPLILHHRPSAQRILCKVHDYRSVELK